MEPVPDGSGRTARATGDGELSLIDERLAALSHPQRRRIVSTFTTADVDRLSLDGLAAELSDGRHRELDRQRLRIELHHVHLPKLSRVGVLEYDSETDLVDYDGDELLEQWNESLEWNTD